MSFKIGDREIGPNCPPLVIAEIGINHGGDINKALKMVEAAAEVGCECIKIQSHIVEDEMISNNIVPGNSRESIWDIMNRCALTEDEEKEIKDLAESKNMIFLSTPFSREASIRLWEMGVKAFKIGSGECNNYPLVEHIAGYGKPIILSTGMNDIQSIKRSVEIIENYKMPYALLHCTSIYPTPYNKIRLGALKVLKDEFPQAIIGLSDHSLSIYPCLGAVSLGASILERHFTLDKTWEGPDIPISMDPIELKNLIEGSRAIHEACGGTKEILQEEQPTINFAYACVVTIKEIKPGEEFTKENIWVKRPGTGEIKASFYKDILGKRAKAFIGKDQQLQWGQIEW